MSCVHCSSNEQQLAVKLATLERQNDDLVKMLTHLMHHRIELQVRTGPWPTKRTVLEAKQHEERLARLLAAQAVHRLQTLLEERCGLYRQLSFYQFHSPLLSPPE